MAVLVTATGRADLSRRRTSASTYTLPLTSTQSYPHRLCLSWGSCKSDNVGTELDVQRHERVMTKALGVGDGRLMSTFRAHFERMEDWG